LYVSFTVGWLVLYVGFTVGWVVGRNTCLRVGPTVGSLVDVATGKAVSCRVSCNNAAATVGRAKIDWMVIVRTATVGTEVGILVTRVVVGPGVGMALCEQAIGDVGFNDDDNRVVDAVSRGWIKTIGLAIRASLCIRFVPIVGGREDRTNGCADALSNMFGSNKAILVGRMDTISIGARRYMSIWWHLCGCLRIR